MKYSQVKSEIFNLNWENPRNYSENAEIIPQAINRAMAEITAEASPIVKIANIRHRQLKNIISDIQKPETLIKYRPSEGLTLRAENAASYSFECDGNGTATVYDRSGESLITLDSNGKFKRYCGFANGNIVIIFDGEYGFSVKNAAAYEEKISDKTADIPQYRLTDEYDLKALCGDFSDFGGRIKINNYNSKGFTAAKEASVRENGILSVKSGFDYELEVYYNAAFTPVTSETADDFELPLEKAAEPLLPLLASYYVWLDDEKTRAQEYYNRYEARREELIYSKTKSRAAVVL